MKASSGHKSSMISVKHKTNCIELKVGWCGVQQRFELVPAIKCGTLTTPHHSETFIGNRKNRDKDPPDPRIHGKLHRSQGYPRLPTLQCPGHTAQPAVIGFAASYPHDPRRFYLLHLGACAWLGPRCREKVRESGTGRKEEEAKTGKDHSFLTGR